MCSRGSTPEIPAGGARHAWASPLAHEILNAPVRVSRRAPLEERRTQAVYARRATEPSSSGDLGALDAAAIERVRDESRPDPRDGDELHDALLTAGFLTEGDARSLAPELFETIVSARRATAFQIPNSQFQILTIWVAAERLPEIRAVHPGASMDPAVEAPPSRADRHWTREQAIVELLRGRLTVLGPTTARTLADSLAISEADADAALLTLESEGAILRGSFSACERGSPRGQWCDRRLLADSPLHPEPVARRNRTGICGRLHALPVLVAARRSVDAPHRHRRPAAISASSTASNSWQARGNGRFSPRAWIIRACDARYAVPRAKSAGRLSSKGEQTDVVGATPIALFVREHADAWAALKGCATEETTNAPRRSCAPAGRRSSTSLRRMRPGDAQLRSAIGDRVAAGLVTSDGFRPGRSCPAIRSRASAVHRPVGGPMVGVGGHAARSRIGTDSTWSPLRRYGVVCRRVIAREANAAPWRG
jgi:ATP-dependent Lhr-like helicase